MMTSGNMRVNEIVGYVRNCGHDEIVPISLVICCDFFRFSSIAEMFT